MVPPNERGSVPNVVAEAANEPEIQSQTSQSVSRMPEAIRLVVMMYVRFPLSLRDVEGLLFERGIDLSHETVRHWWNRCRSDARVRP